MRASAARSVSVATAPASASMPTQYASRRSGDHLVTAQPNAGSDEPVPFRSISAVEAASSVVHSGAW